MPSQEVLQAALNEIGKGYAQYEYFFNKLRTSSWLKPLAKKGYFKEPPGPVLLDEGKYINFPTWPESAYLVRMASVEEAQGKVFQIALGIPETENIRVHNDILDIALALPAAMAAQFVQRIKEWVKSPYKLVLPEKVGSLIVQLADGGQGEAALDLFAATLALGPDPRTPEKETEALFHPEPQAFLSEWHYERTLNRTVGPLVNATGIAVVKVLAELLNSAIDLSRKKAEKGTGDEDYIYVFHPAIEEEGTGIRDVVGSILRGTRDAAEQAIRNDPSQFASVLSDLKGKKWASFRRLELHLCRIFLERSLDETISRFGDLAVLETPSTRHEAVLLLKSAFSRLPTGAHQVFFDWIQRGPDKEGIRRWLGEVPSQEVEDYADRWRRDWLAMLGEQLPAQWGSRLEELVQRLGPARSLETVNRPTATSVGPKSPSSTEELSALDAEQTAQYLRTWQPPDSGFMEASPEGLGRTLEGVVAGRAVEYAAHALAFRNLDPTYVRSVLEGLRQALKEQSVFGWGPVLELAAWVVSQPREIPDRSGSLGDSDPDWGWTRNAIAGLLSDGFGDLPGVLPCELQHPAWAILKSLTNDPDPTPEHEQAYGGKNMGPSTMSINTVRGNTFHALVGFAFWVLRCVEAGPSEGAKPARSFNLMPEVSEVLEAHLDLTVETSLTIRSVYGRWLNHLAYLDRDWTCANLARIFPTEDTTYFRAAWESFIVFSETNELLLRALTPYYQHAVKQLDVVENQEIHPAKPDESLGEHLVIYYWRDKLQLDGEDGLIREFFSRASEEARTHLMWFVGRSVSNWDEVVPDSVFHRLTVLFEYRLGVAREAPNPETFGKELSRFGFWFSSAKFDEKWSLDTLIAVLDLTGQIDFERDITERLIEVFPRYPLECIKALRLMMLKSKESWTILAIANEAKQLLRMAVQSNNSEAQEAARKLIEELIGRRYYDFRDVLTGTS